LLQQQSELQGLLASCRTENDSHKGISKSSKEDWSGPFEWDDRAADIRLNVFGIASYRQNQQEIINAVMSGRDVIVIMAAGGGKSLCYQLPALLLSGTALVVSPLLSLIQDQVPHISCWSIISHPFHTCGLPNAWILL
jgi:ATP-dependent DNA helicase Q1